MASALVIPGALALNAAAASTTSPSATAVSYVSEAVPQAPCRNGRCKSSGHKNKKHKRHHSGKHKKHSAKHKKHGSGHHKKHSGGKHKKRGGR
ncbi:hypothetical protein [Sphaerisporangium rubeum]|uniref:Spy/CpxP family protein refolding chaperone n=1 Tax=Sphaerisporangium rubeum TaxID=321317 RepID=A0A7X0I8N0_9ACTN|nr:hypothetical protein [Sphaerisporangium rubeum]MBB6470662.1 Spy/CpxP family protein refolding chaperone [Sphaerisporangium rubeum]